MRKNEEQFVMVPVSLSPEQAALVGSMVAHDWGIIIQHAGTPIPPCADVETVGYVHGDYPKQGHRAVMCPASMRDPISGRIAHFDTALVRRTDMEAQVAKVSAEKDAEIARLRGVLSEIAESDDIDNALDPERNKRVAREVLNEGSAA